MKIMKTGKRGVRDHLFLSMILPLTLMPSDSRSHKKKKSFAEIIEKKLQPKYKSNHLIVLTYTNHLSITKTDKSLGFQIISLIKRNNTV